MTCQFDGVRVGAIVSVGASSNSDCVACGHTTDFPQLCKMIYLGHRNFEGAAVDWLCILNKVICPHCGALADMFSLPCDDAKGLSLEEAESVSFPMLAKLRQGEIDLDTFISQYLELMRKNG